MVDDDLAYETTECWHCGEQRYIYESCHHCGGSCKPMNKKEQQEKMYKTEIHGHSDDVIVVEGAVTEGVYAAYDEPTEIDINNFVFSAEYGGEGVWTFDVWFCPQSASFCKADIGVGHEYSEILTLFTEDEPEVKTENGRI